jgi:hypothetical protein
MGFLSKFHLKRTQQFKSHFTGVMMSGFCQKVLRLPAGSLNVIFLKYLPVAQPGREALAA